MRVLPFLTLAVTSLFLFKPAAAQEALKVAPNVPWLGRPMPLKLRKLLPAKAQILKCGIAAFGPQGAMRWVVAWANQGKEEERDIKIGSFSSTNKGVRKRSEQSMGKQNIFLPIKLYWLHPKARKIPVVQIGNITTPKPSAIEGFGSLLVLPDGWNGRILTQTFASDEEGGHYISFNFPFVDDKDTLCIKRIHNFIPNQDENEQDEAILKWDGTGWNEK